MGAVCLPAAGSVAGTPTQDGTIGAHHDDTTTTEQSDLQRDT